MRAMYANDGIATQSRGQERGGDLLGMEGHSRVEARSRLIHLLGATAALTGGRAEWWSSLSKAVTSARW